MLLRSIINTYWVRSCINVKLKPAPSYLVDRFKTVQDIHFWNTRSAMNLIPTYLYHRPHRPKVCL